MRALGSSWIDVREGRSNYHSFNHTYSQIPLSDNYEMHTVPSEELWERGDLIDWMTSLPFQLLLESQETQQKMKSVAFDSLLIPRIEEDREIIDVEKEKHNYWEWPGIQERQHLNHQLSSYHTWTVKLFHINKCMIQAINTLSDFWNIYFKYTHFSYSLFSRFLYAENYHILLV